MNIKDKKILRIAGIALLAVIFCILLSIYSKTSSSSKVTTSPAVVVTTATSTSASADPFLMPISDAVSRITKKHFGTYVKPGDSPVSPERFTGYHTGVDFETTPSEQTTDVAISAICSGKVLISQFGSGYGGMFVTSCTLEGQPITVVYGHLRLANVIPKVGDAITAGDKIGVLGTGYSSETDGERKHLHLGIHNGATPVTSGYVATKNQLSSWINFEPYVK